MVLSENDIMVMLKRRSTRREGFSKLVDRYQEPMYRIAINETFRFMEKKRRMMDGSTDLEDYLVQKLESDAWINGNEAEIKLQILTTLSSSATICGTFKVVL